MNLDDVLADLRADEGWRDHAYVDSRGFTSIGYGFLVDERTSGRLPREIGEHWLNLAIEERWSRLVSRAPWLLEQPDDVQRALANMVYQLGVVGVLAFVNMLVALREGKRREAAAHALDSEWAKQTPARAGRVAALIKGRA